MFGKRKSYIPLTATEIKEMYEYLTGEDVMTATLKEVEGWVETGRKMGATHVISVCDCFDYDDFPVYVMPDEDINERTAKYNGVNMQTINEVIEIANEKT